MAFQAPSVGQERANRKILEELQERKKQLRMQTAPAAPSNSSAQGQVPNQPPPAPVVSMAEPHHMTPAQRAALQHAHANSVGYFITQDSSFGNLILPVLPRHEKPS